MKSTAPISIVRKVSEERALTRTKLNSSYEKETYTYQAALLEHELSRSYLVKALLLVSLALGSSAGLLCFADLAREANSVHNIISGDK